MVEAQNSSSYLFTNARVFDGMEMHDGWYVAVKGNEIAYAGPAEHTIVKKSWIVNGSGFSIDVQHDLCAIAISAISSLFPFF